MRLYPGVPPGRLLLKWVSFWKRLTAKMLVVRVRCVDDGRELLVERHGPTEEWRIQVAELKKLVLQQRAQLQCGRDEESKGGDEQAREEDELDECFVFLRGRILADADVVNLFSLSASDFFVFAQDAPQQDPHTQQPTRGRKRKREATHVHDDDELRQLQQQQLTDMGFTGPLAEAALRQSNYNLPDAVALLAEGSTEAQRDVSSGAELDAEHTAEANGDGSKETTLEEELAPTQTRTDLLQRYPSIAPLGSFVDDANVQRLRRLAATNSFQALLLLKECFSSRALAQLSENPVAALRLLSLPAPPPMPGSQQQDQDPGDLITTKEPELRGEFEAAERTASSSTAAIDRLTAMGFTRDLVMMMYDSCGGDEQLTANALLQTLES